MITSKSEAQTKAQAAALAPALTGGTVVCLYGDLGAGKTTFVKGLAEALGVTDNMLSPTFTLMNIYRVPGQKAVKRLIHIDTYRLRNEDELKSIGAEDYIGAPDAITLIEWPEKITTLLAPHKKISVHIEHREQTDRGLQIDL